METISKFAKGPKEVVFDASDQFIIFPKLFATQKCKDKPVSSRDLLSKYDSKNSIK